MDALAAGGKVHANDHTGHLAGQVTVVLTCAMSTRSSSHATCSAVRYASGFCCHQSRKKRYARRPAQARRAGRHLGGPCITTDRPFEVVALLRTRGMPVARICVRPPSSPHLLFCTHLVVGVEAALDQHAEQRREGSLVLARLCTHNIASGFKASQSSSFAWRMRCLPQVVVAPILI